MKKGQGKQRAGALFLSLFAANDYRSVILNSLEYRRERNPNYSLRAFARDLSIAPSTLSELLKGKTGISKEMALQIAEELKFNIIETDFFCSLVDLETSRSNKLREEARQRVEQLRDHGRYRKVNLDSMNLVADWHHFAISEFVRLPNFREDHAWIADELGLQEKVVTDAIERLIRVEILKREKGLLTWVGPYQSAKDGVSALACRRHYRQVFDLAKNATLHQGPEERYFSTMFVAMNRKDLDYVKKKLAKLRDELGLKLADAKDKDDIYCLALNFFSVLNRQKDKSIH